MSFLNTLAAIFGFSDHDTEDDAMTSEMKSLAPATSSLATEPANSGNISDVPVSSKASAAADSSAEDPSVMFSGVVELLNRELPPYLRQSLNEESQRRYIYDNLQKSFKDYISSVVEEQKKKILASSNRDKEKLKAQIADLKEKLQVSEEKFTRESEKSLSAERQRRALSARMRDLESNILSLEAEKEQFDLENKSLLNKLRLLSINSNIDPNSPDLDSMVKLNQEIESLKKELEQTKTESNELKVVNGNLERHISELENETKTLKEEKKDLLEEKKAILDENRKLKDTDPEIRIPEAGETASQVFETVSFDDTPTVPEKQPTENKEKPKAKKEKKQPKKPVINAIDDSLASTDWLVSTPPDHVAEEPNDNTDFGYQEPPRKKESSNPAQMSLF